MTDPDTNNLPEVVSGEVLSPPTARLVAGFGQGTPMTPWERHQLEWRVRRERAKAIVELAEVERSAVLAARTIEAKGELAATVERAELRHLKAAEECLRESGHVLADALHDAGELSDDVRDAVKRTMQVTHARYMKGVERRQGKLV